MIRSLLLVVVVVVVSLSIAQAAFAQAGGGGGGRGGGLGGMMQRNALNTYVAALGELNLDPDFTLTADQKKQIKVIRDDYKKAMDDFNTQNKDELDKARQAMRDARGDQTAMQTARQKLTDLMAKGPKAEDYVAKIKAVLVGDQADKVDKKVQELQAQRPFGGMGGAGAGGAGAGGRRGGAGAAGGAGGGGRRGRGGGGGGGN